MTQIQYLNWNVLLRLWKFVDENNVIKQMMKHYLSVQILISSDVHVLWVIPFRINSEKYVDATIKSFSLCSALNKAAQVRCSISFVHYSPHSILFYFILFNNQINILTSI